jgi:hypothetical protein
MGAQDKSVQLKLGLLKLAGEIGSVSKACEMMNFSRDSFYRFRALYLRGGEEALKNVNRKRPLLKNRVSPSVESAVHKLALDHPEYGQQKASAILKARNIVVSPSGIRSIWIRHDLETRGKRSQAIRALILQDGLAPNPQQLAVIDNISKSAKPDALETGGPGFLCLHGLEPLGNIAGIGPVYLHIFQDVYSRYTFIHLDTDKGSSIAKLFLKGHVLPWFQHQKTPIRKIQSDRTLTFYDAGNPEGYQEFLKNMGIEHSFRSACRHGHDKALSDFFQTIKDEFFRFALPSRTNWKLAPLLHAANEWVSFYNTTRPNMHRFCYGKTPEKTFLDTRSALLGEISGDQLSAPEFRRSSA